MGGVLIGLAVIGSVIAVGYVAARCGLGGTATVTSLTRTAFFITNPVLLFTVVLKSDLAVVFSAYVPLALITAAVTALIYTLASRSDRVGARLGRACRCWLSPFLLPGSCPPTPRCS